MCKCIFSIDTPTVTPFEHVHHVPKKCDSELVPSEVFAFYKGYAFGRLREWKDLMDKLCSLEDNESFRRCFVDRNIALSLFMEVENRAWENKFSLQHGSFSASY